jgi:hypothetical protein
MADVLGVATLQIGNPVTFVVLMKADYPPLHGSGHVGAKT